MARFQDVVTPDAPLRVSASFLKNWLACPRKAYFENLLSLPSTMVEDPLADKSPLVRGRLGHLLLQWVAQARAWPEPALAQTAFSVAGALRLVAVAQAAADAIAGWPKEQITAWEEWLSAQQAADREMARHDEPGRFSQDPRTLPEGFTCLWHEVPQEEREWVAAYDSAPWRLQRLVLHMIDELRRRAPLVRANLLEELHATLVSLARHTYFFDVPPDIGPPKIRAEKRIEVSFPEWGDRVRLVGRIDAMRELPDGSWHLMEYKFWSTARGYGQKNPNTREEHLAQCLSLVKDPDVLDPLKRYSSNEAHQLFQLPLYYLALKDQGVNVSRVSLVVLRPCKETLKALRAHGGVDDELRAALNDLAVRRAETAADELASVMVDLSPTLIDHHRTAFLNDVRQEVIDPLLAMDHVPVRPQKACKECDWRLVCEGPSLYGTAGDAEEAA